MPGQSAGSCVTFRYFGIKLAPECIWCIYPYNPELSLIESLWNDVKQHHLVVRSFEQVGELKQVADDALEHKALQLGRNLPEVRTYNERLLSPGETDNP